jgi:hypothetical protein
MLRWFVISVLLTGCAAPPTPTTPPSAAGEYGPTEMKKVQGGYELANRKLRLVIDEKTGHVTYFGSAQSHRNLLLEPGIIAVLPGKRGSEPPDGYVEKRDDQTWQYIGDTLTGVRWRKVYCLEHGSAYVTMLVENRTRHPLDTAIALRARFDGGQTVTERADLHEYQIGSIKVRLQAFNEAKPERPDWATLIGDSRTLAPGERIGVTMEWKVEGL